MLVTLRPHITDFVRQTQQVPFRVDRPTASVFRAKVRVIGFTVPRRTIPQEQMIPTECEKIVQKA